MRSAKTSLLWLLAYLSIMLAVSVPALGQMQPPCNYQNADCGSVSWGWYCFLECYCISDSYTYPTMLCGSTWCKEVTYRGTGSISPGGGGWDYICQAAVERYCVAEA
jgi:hypothetical protein